MAKKQRDRGTEWQPPAPWQPLPRILHNNFEEEVGVDLWTESALESNLFQERHREESGDGLRLHLQRHFRRRKSVRRRELGEC